MQYLVLNLGDARASTHSVSKTLNPEWNVIEQLPVNSVNSLILDVICWDKDRFGKDYLGEFDLALEEIFQNEKPEQAPKWYPLRSKRPGKKTGVVSGEVLLQFSLFDSSDPDMPHHQVMNKFQTLARSVMIPSRTVAPPAASVAAPLEAAQAAAGDGVTEEDAEEELSELDEETPEEEDAAKPETAEKRRRRLRIRGLKRKNRRNPYAFTNGGSDVVGIIFMEVCRITDLPPESNLTRTSFDMDPFVVASLGKKTYRTRRVKHNLNPHFNEKMIFQVQSHETSYSFAFTVIDHDKYSGNDFIASCNLPVQDLVKKAPQTNPSTGLYELREPPDHAPVAPKSRFKRMGLSRTSSSQSLSKGLRPQLHKTLSGASASGTATPTADHSQAPSSNPPLPSTGEAPTSAPTESSETVVDDEDQDLNEFVIPLKMKNLDKWEAKHNPAIYLRAKYVPYPALRQQFWRAMLRQYDSDESGRISRIELTTMLDTLGSTLKDSTIDSFFQRFPHKAADNEETWDLTFDEAVLCLEDQLEARSKQSAGMEKIKSLVGDVKNMTFGNTGEQSSTDVSGTSTPLTAQNHIPQSESGNSLSTPSDEGGEDYLSKDEDDRGEEHVVEIRECPICHQPRLNKRNDTDIITHIATCASQDWRQVNTVLLGRYVTASQAQRKWYSKVITKISYGGYKLGANSANILVQDRMTGQINEEKMSVYVRLGIRMLYKGLKSRDMENKRSEYLSVVKLRILLT